MSMRAKARSEAKKQAILWLDMGWPRHRIDERLYEMWDATPAETTEILKEIRHEQKDSLSIERAEFLAQQMTRLEALASRAVDQDNLAVALGAFKELHALAGLYQK
jgi:hypothetical protein